MPFAASEADDVINYLLALCCVRFIHIQDNLPDTLPTVVDEGIIVKTGRSRSIVAPILAWAPTLQCTRVQSWTGVLHDAGAVRAYLLK